MLVVYVRYDRYFEFKSPKLYTSNVTVERVIKVNARRDRVHLFGIFHSCGCVSNPIQRISTDID